jgi:hypothetical protein
MKQSTRIRWAAAAVVGLAVMLLVYFFGLQPEVETTRPPVAPDRPSTQTWLSPQVGTAPASTSTVSATDPTATDPKVPAQPAASSVATLRAELAKATNLRQFVESAKQRAPEGGFFYAQLALNQCASVAQEIQAYGSRLPAVAGESGAQAAERQRRLSAIRTRCEGLTRADTNYYGSYLNLSSDSRVKDDPIWQARAKFGQHSDAYATATPDSTAAAYRELLATQNLELFLETQLGFTRDGAYFEGEYFIARGTGAAASQYDTIVLRYGKELAACLLGNPCGPTELLRLEYVCAFAGECHSTYESYIRAALIKQHGAEKGEAAYRKALSLAQPIATAFRNQDVKAFLPRP